MRDAERVREPAGAEHGLRRAAASLAVGPLVGPELERHGDDLAAGVTLPKGGHGGVDPAAERDQGALPRGGPIGQRLARSGERGQRPVKGIGRQHRRMAMRRRESPERRLDLIRADQRRLQDPGPLGELRCRRRGCGGRGAPLVVEADLANPSPRRKQREPDEVAAGRATRGTAE